jgi:hypothetical protein
MRFQCDSNRINVNVEQWGIESISVSIFQPTAQKECKMDSAMLFGKLGRQWRKTLWAFSFESLCASFKMDNVAEVTRSKDACRLQQHFSKNDKQAWLFLHLWVNLPETTRLAWEWKVIEFQHRCLLVCNNRLLLVAVAGLLLLRANGAVHPSLSEIS